MSTGYAMVLVPTTGKATEYRQLLHDLILGPAWQQVAHHEFDRLFNGYSTIKDSNTMRTIL